MKFRDHTLGDIVASDFRSSQVFTRHNIDFCCSGKRNFVNSCIEAGLDPAVIEGEILSLENAPRTDMDYNSMKPEALIDFILHEHHQYIENESRSLVALADKVAHAHSSGHPELVEVAKTVRTIMDDMLAHQLKEEQVLFPYIKAAAACKANGTPPPEACFGNIANPIQAMYADHDNVGSLMFRLKEQTSNFDLPHDACASYKVLYRRLEALQNNTFRHVHLENNILFRDALTM